MVPRLLALAGDARISSARSYGAFNRGSLAKVQAAIVRVTRVPARGHPAFGGKPFIAALARVLEPVAHPGSSLTGVPPTGTCPPDNSSATLRCARIAALILRDIPVVSGRSRLLVKTVGLRARRLPRSGLKSVHRTNLRAPFTPDRVIHPETGEPAEHEVILHLLPQLPLRTG